MADVMACGWPETTAARLRGSTPSQTFPHQADRGRDSRLAEAEGLRSPAMTRYPPLSTPVKGEGSTARSRPLDGGRAGVMRRNTHVLRWAASPDRTAMMGISPSAVS